MEKHFVLKFLKRGINERFLGFITSIAWLFIQPIISLFIGLYLIKYFNLAAQRNNKMWDLLYTRQ